MPTHVPALRRGCRRSAPLWILFAAFCLHGPCLAGSLYLCKTYGGAMFWSGAHCREHNALIDRIESVPDGLPFDQQVELAQQSRAAAAKLYEATPRSRSTQSNAAGAAQVPNLQGKAEECKALDAEITRLDAMARQPQSAQVQDWIRAEKKRARDRQFQVRC